MPVGGEGRTFAIVGPGRVGTALARALRCEGMKLVGVIGRDDVHSRRAVEALGVADFPQMRTEWPRVAEEADIVFISTPDRVIGSVARRLADELETVGWTGSAKKRVVFHLSGALGSEVLQPLRTWGFEIAALHPMQSISGDPEALYDVAWGIEGDEGAIRQAEVVVALLGGTPLRIETAAKPLYHAAACVVSNYLMLLLHIGVELFEKVGISKSQAAKALGSLMTGSLRSALERGVPEALTGPIERGDAATVARHLAAFHTYDVCQGTDDLYRRLGRETVRMALAKGSIDESQASEVLRTLNAGLGEEVPIAANDKEWS